MANAYVGNPYALVFPVDCDGFLKIPYGSHTDITETDLWSHGAGFTVEAVITPYDVNGNGQTGKGKTLEITGPSGSYTNSISNRYTQKMMLFSNSSFQFYLENQTALPDGVTTTSAPVNQPAEYRLGAKVGSTTLTSPIVIKPVNTLHGYYDEKGFYNGMRTSLTQISTNASHSPPSRVITIDNNNFTNETNVVSASATGDVTFSGAPESYYPAQQASTSITFTGNNFAVDTTPVAGTGTIEFHSTLGTATDNTASRYIQVVSEDGNTTTRWFPVSGQTHSNNVDLNVYDPDAWDSGDRGFVITDGSGNLFSRQGQAKQFSDAVNAWNNGWAGSTAAGTILSGQDDIITFTAAIRGTSPNRLGTGGSLSTGSGILDTVVEVTSNMSGGVDEVVSNEYITINTGSGNKQYRVFPSGLAGSIQTSSSVNYITFRKGASLSDTMSSLVTAINHTNGNNEVTATTLSNNGVTLTVDAAGTAGNSLATPTTTNISFVNTISAFSGGEAANETNKHIQLVDADGTTVKFLAAHQTKSTNSTGSTITLSGVQYVIYRLPTSGSNRANFASAVNGASNLDITAANDGSNGHKVNLTQDGTGTSGNTTITLANSISNVTATSFTGGAGANPNVAIDITNATGSTVRYKPSVNENTGTSDSTYTFFQKGGSAAATATNLASAINSTQGTTVLATPSSNTVTITMLTAGNSYAATENSSSVSLDSGFTALADKITVDVNQTGLLGVGNKIYDSNGVLVSTVSAINGTLITLDDVITSVTSTIYKEQPKEALYVNNLYKVSCVLEKSGKLKLFFNNTLVAETAISSFTFDMANADCFIGQDGTNISTQFMGELYEIGMKKGVQPSASIHTLEAGYSDIIFYYRFGDE